jgi:hypothetical protein
VTPDYARAAGMRIIDGRGIAATDDARAQHVAVVNQMLAESMWPGLSAIGRTVTIEGASWTVVGVAANVRHGGFDEPVRYTIYRSVYQAAERAGDLAVWTDRDPAAMADVVRRRSRERIRRPRWAASGRCSTWRLATYRPFE